MGEPAKVTAIYTDSGTLIERTREYLAANKMNIGQLAKEIQYGRTTLNLYLTGKNNSTAVEAALTSYLGGKEANPEAVNGTPEKAVSPARKKKRGNTAKRPELFKSEDYRKVLGVCQSCQDFHGLGLITGRSGFGKTYALEDYAKLPRVAYIKCDITMSSRDLLEDIEKALKIPPRYGSNHVHIRSIADFLSANEGYLIIIDEAHKLMSKYTQNKMYILQAIFDLSSAGIVLAGVPKMKAQIMSYIDEVSNRIDYEADLEGLSRKEVEEYLAGFDVDIDSNAIDELKTRARNSRTGCFRLLARTLANALRIIKESGEQTITLETVKEASGYMLL